MLIADEIIVERGHYRCARTGKRSFVTKRDAKDFAKCRKHDKGGRLQHVYECQHCGGYHLTTMKLSQTVRIQTRRESQRARRRAYDEGWE